MDWSSFFSIFFLHRDKVNDLDPCFLKLYKRSITFGMHDFCTGDFRSRTLWINGAFRHLVLFLVTWGLVKFIKFLGQIGAVRITNWSRLTYEIIHAPYFYLLATEEGAILWKIFTPQFQEVLDWHKEYKGMWQMQQSRSFQGIRSCGLGFNVQLF